MHLCALFIKAHGVDGDYECALDAANSAAKHLQVIQAELPATSPLARDAGMLAKFVRAAQRNLSQQCPVDNPDELLGLATLSLIHISEPTRPVCSSRMPSSA